MAIGDCHVIKVRMRDVANGFGIRVSVWTAGCPHTKICTEHCHNKDTWDWNQGYNLTENMVRRILDGCDKRHIDGLTITGGDPLFPKSREGVEYLCKKFRERFGDSKTIWLWTGYLWENIKDLQLIKNVDVVVDGPFVKSLSVPNLKYRGSTNQRVIDCKTGKAITDEV